MCPTAPLSCILRLTGSGVVRPAASSYSENGAHPGDDASSRRASPRRATWPAVPLSVSKTPAGPAGLVTTASSSNAQQRSPPAAPHAPPANTAVPAVETAVDTSSALTADRTRSPSPSTSCRPHGADTARESPSQQATTSRPATVVMTSTPREEATVVETPMEIDTGPAASKLSAAETETRRTPSSGVTVIAGISTPSSWLTDRQTNQLTDTEHSSTLFFTNNV